MTWKIIYIVILLIVVGLSTIAPCIESSRESERERKREQDDRRDKI